MLGKICSTVDLCCFRHLIAVCAGLVPGELTLCGLRVKVVLHCVNVSNVCGIINTSDDVEAVNSCLPMTLSCNNCTFAYSDCRTA